ncbi:MAG: ATP-binding protein [Pseudomonadota bacterium]|jgi:signal transduction histidine kinase
MANSTKVFEQVLLVEDETAHALLIERAVRSLVGNLIKCKTVTEGQAALAAGQFDLIISDLNLPDMRSEAAVNALRQVAPKTPLLVLTSSSSLSDGVAAMRAGANDFMVKNFDASFADVLHLVLSRLRAAQQAENERAQAMRDRDLLREAIENSNDGLAVVQRSGKVRYCNSGFKQFLADLGVASADVSDIPDSAIKRGSEVLPKLRDKLSALAPGEVWATELVRAGDDEAAFELSVSASGTVMADETLVLWVRDISDKRRRERFQREILSTTTHDLKGPLGAIAVSCDVLLDSPAPDQRAHALLERISTSANSAINLIEEFLSMRRIEEGAFVMRPVTSPLHEVVARVAESFALTAKTRGMQIVLSFEDPQVLGCVDILGLERIVTNLISNAVKFSAAGGRIDVGVERRDGGVVLRVRDFGVGMEPGDAKRLFQRYARLSAHSSVSGSGLGLFIVKCIVSAHGGSIDVTSALGKGTTFEIFLPDRPPCNERGEVLCLDLG